MASSTIKQSTGFAKGYSFSIPAGGTVKLTFSGTYSALLLTRAWQGGRTFAAILSGYHVASTRNDVTVLTSDAQLTYAISDTEEAISFTSNASNAYSCYLLLAIGTLVAIS